VAGYCSYASLGSASDICSIKPLLSCHAYQIIMLAVPLFWYHTTCMFTNCSSNHER